MVDFAPLMLLDKLRLCFYDVWSLCGLERQKLVFMSYNAL
jgi:hypothetical protein